MTSNQKAGSNQPTGRIVLNHSTHLKGLIKTLNKLVQNPHISTITPGRIARTKSKPCRLRIKVSVPITGGFKLQARCERAAQEVFVITTLEKTTLQEAIDIALGSKRKGLRI